MKEVIVRLTSDHIKVKGAEYVRDYEPKRGKWIDWLGKGNEWECSVCKCSIESHGSIAYNFCPMCGADMRKGTDDEQMD